MGLYVEKLKKLKKKFVYEVNFKKVHLSVTLMSKLDLTVDLTGITFDCRLKMVLLDNYYGVNPV